MRGTVPVGSYAVNRIMDKGLLGFRRSGRQRGGRLTNGPHPCPGGGRSLGERRLESAAYFLAPGLVLGAPAPLADQSDFCTSDIPTASNVNPSFFEK